MIKTTAEGWSVIEGDTHHAKWVEECRNIVHDPFMAGVVKRLVKPHQNAVDAGANIGTLTLAMIDAYAEVIIAVDANAEALECLKRNVKKRDPLQDLRVICAPLWAYSGEALSLEMSDNVGASHIVKRPGCASKSLSDILNAEGCEVGFIKLDVEGCESMAICGAMYHILFNRPNLLVEVNRGALERIGRLVHSVPHDEVGFLRSFLQKFYKNVDIVQSDCNWDSPQFDVACY